MKGIDPKYIVWLGLAVAIEQAIGHGTVSLTNIVPAEWAPYVTSWCNMLAFIGTSIMTYQAAVSGPQTGPLVNIQPPAITPTVVKVLLVAFALSFLVAGGSAQAQGLIKPLARPAPAASGLQKLMNDLAALQKKVVDDTVADIAAADADAATLTNPSDATSFKDPISHACYPAATKFLQSLPAASPTTGTLIAVQLFQKKRDFVAQIQAGIPVYLKLGCAPLLGDEAAIFTKVMGLVGVSVAANTLLPGIGAILPALP